MSPIVDSVYNIECWDDDVLYIFRGRCVCEQPLENGLYLFDVDGEEVEVGAKEIIREISRELV